MNKKMEILAPAGNVEALKAAVFAGADAVYLGGSLFSARASAVNFTNEELIEATEFCRVRGVKVYVTVNTLIKNSEFAEAAQFIKFLCSVPVDGILVQDMGLFALISSLAPEMPLHCSTQMSIHTPRGTKLMAELGADRVVLSRELSLSEIKEIHGATPVELESFVHGALCMSVSGQCYFSAMLGSRSGNRGRCAQTCRLPFESPYGGSHALSLKDMSFIRDIKLMEENGICSAKIEGRMKRPEYVAAAVKACRLSADGETLPEDLMENLEAVFSRSGFTEGYLKGDRSDMFGIRRKEDVAAGSSSVFKSLHELYRSEAGRVPLKAKFVLKQNEPSYLCLSDYEGNIGEMTSKMPELANNRPMDAENLKSRISKMGGTPYYVNEIEVVTDGLSVMPASKINELRRACTEILSEKRGVKQPFHFGEYMEDSTRYSSKKLSYRGVFRNINQIPFNANAFEYIYLPMTESVEDFKKILAMGIKVGCEIPRSFFGGEEEVVQKAKTLMDNGINTFLCGNIGALAICKELGAEIHTSFSMNISNTQSLKYMEQLGVSACELSFELTLDEIKVFGGNIPRGIMIYGRQSLMLVRNCPVSLGGCRSCGKTKTIKDRKGTKFPVLCHKGQSYDSIEIFNSVSLSLSDRQKEINMVDFGILRFTVENSVEIGEIIEDFIRQENPHNDYTRGLFYRGII